MTGRVSALHKLLASLEAVGSEFDGGKGTVEDFEASRWRYERRAAHAALGQVLDFLWALEKRDLDRHLKPLYLALENVEQGLVHPMLTPARTNRPPTSTAARTLQGRIASVQDWLMEKGRLKKGHLTEKEAAEFVFKSLGFEAIAHLSGVARPETVTWRTVKRWRDLANEGGGTTIAESFADGLWVAENYEPTEANVQRVLDIMVRDLDSLLPRRADKSGKG